MSRKQTRRMAPGEVTVSRLAPEPSSDIDDADLLYVPVPQLVGDPDSTFKLSYEWIEPQQAQQLLDDVAQAPDFRQRKIDAGQARRWKNLLETERFLHYFPGGPLAREETGLQINGQHRMKGIVLSGVPAGFVVFHNVPRWMFRFFDTNKKRSLTDVLEISDRDYGRYTPSTLSLSLRYEEFIQGRRSGEGWRHWATVKDEHHDLDYFLQRRPNLEEWRMEAGRIYANCHVMAPSVVTFALYQSLAWPEGVDHIEEFLEKLKRWRYQAPEHPARVLANWSNNNWLEKQSMSAKRELHLLLLFRAFAQHMNESRIHTILWAFGNPMTMPYHPKGPDVAVANVRQMLADMDEMHYELR